MDNPAPARYDSPYVIGPATRMPPPPKSPPEARARQAIDAQLETAGWIVQDEDAMNIHAGQGVAVREFHVPRRHGPPRADYLLIVDQRPLGVFEAKPAGHTPTGVELQARQYTDGLPAYLDPPVCPLPFMHVGTGAETRFTDLLDPKPRS